MLQKVRSALLTEARQSPSLLSDLAGLEHYVAESYNARSFVELLQNADDARAARFTVRQIEGFLLVANDGRTFNQTDFEALCRSASSSKSRGSSIGYRGIGFKSVVHFSREVMVFSGELEAVFSREKTAADVPSATRYPLIRVPHPISSQEYGAVAKPVKDAQMDGFTTVFVFTGVDHQAIQAEFGMFSASTLLFLRHVRQVDLRTSTQTLFSLSRADLGQGRTKVCLQSAEDSKEWMLFASQSIALAFGLEDGKVAPLDRDEAVVHAFLPTLESTGTGVKINGDFSTDPSRTRVTLDESTRHLLHEAAQLYVDLILNSLTSPEATYRLAALVPDFDPRLIALQRPSFKTELLAAVLTAAKGKFDRLRLNPAWINSKDFQVLITALGFQTLPEGVENIPGCEAFFKAIGAQDLGFEVALHAARQAQVSSIGAAELVVTLARKLETKQVTVTPVMRDLPLWQIGSELRSLDAAVRSGEALNPDFRALLAEKGSSVESVRRLIISLDGVEAADAMFPQEQTNSTLPEGFNRVRTVAAPITLSGVSRWRSAEIQLAELLNVEGWAVSDVSRKNEGYDLSGVRPNGQPIHIEVKAVDSFRAPFIMPNNELLVARQLKDQYWIALVKSSAEGVEVAFIENPGDVLDLNRQCRQWVWECERFEANPIQYRYKG